MTTSLPTPWRSSLWLQGVVAGIVVAVFPGTALLASVLLCPAFLVYAVETAAGHPLARTMIMCGSTAALWPLRTLLGNGNTLAAALDLLADPEWTLLSWACCGSGWLLYEVAQALVRIASTVQSNRQVEALRREQADLNEEWTFTQ